jgi:hypothetical protein
MTQLTEYAKRAILEKLAGEEDSFTFTQEIAPFAKFDFEERVTDGHITGTITEICVLSFPDAPPGEFPIAYEVTDDEDSRNARIVPEGDLARA